MRSFVFASLFLLSSISLFGQGVSCPAVVAAPDTTISCSSPCFQLRSTAVSGFETSTYRVQQIPYSPYPFNQGTAILLNIDDTWSSVIPIPFNFCFYGVAYNQLVIGSNGLVSFDLSQANQYCQWPITVGIPSNQNPMNSIMGPFHDIDPSVAGTIRWNLYGSAPCRVFVVSFEGCALFSCNNLTATQQIVLYETTNVIETYIQNKPTCSGWNSGAAIHGIQNATGTQATVVPGRNYPTQWTASNDAWAFIPDGNQNYTIRWYEVGSSAATIATTDTTTICPTASTAYVAEVTYTNCDNSTVVVTDTATITINGNSNISVTTSTTDVSCFGGSDGTATATAVGPGPWLYTWSTSPAQTWSTATGLSAGNYTVTVSDINGCNVVQQVTINQPTQLSASATSTDVDCAGGANGTATASASGGTGTYTYDWGSGPGPATVSGLSGGSYTVTVTDQNGCQATASVGIAEPTPLTTTVAATDVLCFGGNNGTVEATPSGGTPPYNYTWSSGPGGQVIQGLGAGSYTVTVIDANGCTTTAQADVAEPTEMIVSVAGIDEICRGEDAPITSTVTGGVPPYAYQWVSMPNSINDTNASISPRPYNTSIYVLQVRDANGCMREVRHEVVVNPRPLIDFSPSVREGCDTLVVDFTNNTQFGGTYLWSFGDGQTSTQQSPTHTFTTGIFDVKLTVTSPEGCVSTATQNQLVTVLPTPQASFVSDPNLELIDHLLLSEATVNLVQTSIYANYHNWSFGNGDSIYGGDAHYTFPDSGWFNIVLTSYNRFGCYDQASQLVLVLQDPFLWVPTAFSPNGDGLNDLFVVQGLMVTDYEIHIFDRWGKEIYVGQTLDDSWDGTFAGQKVQEGGYVYKINAVVNTGQKIERGGTILLLR